MGQTLILLFLLIFPLSFTVYGFYEILEEINFKKKGITTIGKVVGSVSAIHHYEEYQLLNGPYASKPETRPGEFLIFEYNVGDETWRSRTLKTYKKPLTELTVIYNPKDPSDLMVNGFYRVGSAKYYRIIAGLFFYGDVSKAFYIILFNYSIAQFNFFYICM
ncbi:DUF3592 domain-containing protein [Chondrinema litorale]|uniref:DUF3592 domain-containing protein n=1 Tax=Chondrinema litorale TaxID=2994555 RepID=UPI0025439DE6|nr:hypothetical protein [Chondrinema litorale]UZR99736.1 hypothetical protein OQ292_38240 [Chondrinema litorale]